MNSIHTSLFPNNSYYWKVNISESSWYLDSNILHINLVKVHKGETWESALLGRGGNLNKDGCKKKAPIVDPATKEKMKKDLMLERFQEENSSFDFRDATFNGEVPDPRTFMGGISHTK